jgi:FtsX-like permease family
MAMSIHLARKKILGEAGFSTMVVAIMVAGLTGWIVIPAIGSSLESGLSGYANTAGTYVIVDFNGNPLSQQSTLPSNVIDWISRIAGVQAVYPVDVNFVTFQFPNYSQPPPPGGRVSLKGAYASMQSAVIGGPYGFPPSLIGLVAGRLPNSNEPGFVVNSPLLQNLNNQGHPFTVGDRVNASIAGVNFTAFAVGVNAYNPLVGGSVLALWDSAFLQNVLGQNRYNQTFGVGANLLIVKIDSVGQVVAAADSMTNMLSAYPDYLVTYDQATVNNLVSVESGTAPLYELIGVVSVGSSVAAMLFVSFLAASRRGWETGLLMAVGWNWNQVTRFLFAYFLILVVISFALSGLFSYALSQNIRLTSQVYGSTLVMRPSISPFDFVSAGLIAVGIAGAAASLMRWRLGRAGVDELLREF